MEQLYINNTAIKYPLSDFHTETIPNDVVIDFAISMPDGLTAYLTNLVVTEKLVFASFEDSGGTALGHVMVVDPLSMQMYQLTMTAAGFGWIVFGPGIKTPGAWRTILVAMDPRTVCPVIPAGAGFTLRINGKDYAMPAVLNIAMAGYCAQRADAATLTIIRDDNKLSELQRQTLFTSETRDPGNITSINGVLPDSNGNIDLVFDITSGNESSSSSSGYSSSESGAPADSANLSTIYDQASRPLGFLVHTTGLPQCPPDTLSELLKCRTEYGIVYPLPLDYVNCDPGIVCPPW